MWNVNHHMRSKYVSLKLNQILCSASCFFWRQPWSTGLKFCANAACHMNKDTLSFYIWSAILQSNAVLFSTYLYNVDVRVLVFKKKKRGRKNYVCLLELKATSPFIHCMYGVCVRAMFVNRGYIVPPPLRCVDASPHVAPGEYCIFWCGS